MEDRSASQFEGNGIDPSTHGISQALRPIPSRTSVGASIHPSIQSTLAAAARSLLARSFHVRRSIDVDQSAIWTSRRRSRLRLRLEAASCGSGDGGGGIGGGEDGSRQGRRREVRAMSGAYPNFLLDPIVCLPHSLALCSLSTQCLSKESYWETPGCARV